MNRIPIDSQQEAIDTLARTIWGEARGETLLGMEAVAAVVLNRVAVAQRRGGRFWWGRDIQSVCRRPLQFSCWNPNDPNRDKLLRVTSQDRIFAMCTRIARRAVAGLLADPTSGADHYHAVGISPNWTHGKFPTVQIGNHIFYKLEE